MWEKIKKFFKWIADHTGISWIARKISSGWKWLFGGKASATQQNTSQQEKSSGNERQEPAQAQSKGHTTPKTLDNKVNPDQLTPPKQPASSNMPNFVQQNTKLESYLEFTDNKLLFITTNKNYKVLEAEYKNKDQKGKVIPKEFRVFVECDGENFCVTGSYDSQQDVSGGKKSVSITSIRKQNPQSLVLSDPSEMMYQVGLNENRKFVKISRMNREPFKAPTLEQPNPNVTSHNVTQQTVSNEEVTTESEKFFDAEDDGVTQPSSTTTDMVVEQADTPNQPIPSAVPNEPQETLVNAHEEKGKPNNAKEVQPEVSNKEVAAEEHASSSTTTGQQSDLNAGTKEIDNLQASAGDSTPSSSSSSFDIVEPDESQEHDKNGPELLEVSERGTDATGGLLSDSALASGDEHASTSRPVSPGIHKDENSESKAPANDDEPSSLIAASEVQTAINKKRGS